MVWFWPVLGGPVILLGEGIHADALENQTGTRRFLQAWVSLQISSAAAPTGKEGGMGVFPCSLLDCPLEIISVSFLPCFSQLLWPSAWKTFIYLIGSLLKCYVFIVTWCVSIVKPGQILKIGFPLICAVHLNQVASWAFKTSWVFYMYSCTNSFLHCFAY